MLAIACALQRQFELDTKGIGSQPGLRTPWPSQSRSLALSRESTVIVQDGGTIESSFVYHRGFASQHFKQLTREASQLADPMSSLPATTKGWSPDDLVALGPRMQHIPRVSAVKNDENLYDIIKDYETSGVPLIIEDWDKTPHWPGDELFSVNWLLQHGDEMISVRDCVTSRDREIPFKEFIEKSRTISEYAEEGETERLYGKDAVCPKEWQDWLKESAIPDVLKPGSSDDVLELLPEQERVETLMCYYGIGDTFTAAHKDLCASSGHNLMCSAERGGSAFWFMTRSSDAAHAASHFQKLGAELDHETHVATPKEFAKAPFNVYVAEQRVGDLVLVPRRSCHQVVNHGGITAKMSWSRMTIEGLSIGFHHELPIYRRICRSETYRVKLLVYRTLLKYVADLEREQEQLEAIIPAGTNAWRKARSKRASSTLSGISTLTPPSSPEPTDDEYEMGPALTLTPEHEKLVADVRTLLSIYDKILKEEHHGDTPCEMRIRRSTAKQNPDKPAEPGSTDPSSIPVPAELYHDGLTCDFCGADIFSSFFECRACSDPSAQDDNIIVCPSCYVEGRSCACSLMTPLQQFPMDMLLEVQHKAQRLLNFVGYGNNTVRVVALSHQAIDKLVNHPGIFAAACQLLQIRGYKKKGTNTCRQLRKNEKSHVVTVDSAISCKKCHWARCYKHILKYGYHVSDALKLHLSDRTHEKWHSHHMKRSKLWIDQSYIAQKAEETGEPCDMSVSLVLHAGKYTSCRPMSNKLHPGWYDNVWFLDPTELTVPQPNTTRSNVRDFTGPVLDQSSDETTDGDVSESSSGELFDDRPPTRKSSGLKLRLKMKPVSHSRTPKSRCEPYVLLRKLSRKEREKYRLTYRPVSKTSKGTLKRPPGIPANEILFRQPRYTDETFGDPWSDEDENLDTRDRASVVPFGPPSKRKKVRTVKRNVEPKRREQQSVGPLTMSVPSSSKTRLEKNSIRHGSTSMSVSRSSKRARTPAIDDFYGDMYWEPTGNTPPPNPQQASPVETDPALSSGHAAGHNSRVITDILQRLEKNEREIGQEKQEKEELVVELRKLRGDLQKDKEESQCMKEALQLMEDESQRMIEELQQTNGALQRAEEGMIQLRQENARLRRELSMRSDTSINAHLATVNARAEIQPRDTASENSTRRESGSRRADRPPVVVALKNKRSSLPSGNTALSSPSRSQPHRQDKTNSTAPVTPQNDLRAMKRKRSLVVGDDETYSDEPLRRAGIPFNGQHSATQTPGPSVLLSARETEDPAPPRPSKPRPKLPDIPQDEDLLQLRMIYSYIEPSVVDAVYDSTGRDPLRTVKVLSNSEFDGSIYEQEQNVSAVRTYNSTQRTIRNNSDSKRRKYDNDLPLSLSSPRTPPRKNGSVPRR